MMIRKMIGPGAIRVVPLCLFALVYAISARTPSNHCQLPVGLGEELSRKYPGTHVVTLSDLDKYDRKLFQKDYGSRCPGLVRVNFFGDGKPTWAVVLIAGENPKQKAELIVARQTNAGWEIRSLEETDGTPVVWREGPGKYEGMSEPQTIRAKYPVIVFCGYGSWAILYSWTGKDVVKTWISD
jgi:hypothetical protein